MIPVVARRCHVLVPARLQNMAGDRRWPARPWTSRSSRRRLTTIVEMLAQVVENNSRMTRHVSGLVDALPNLAETVGVLEQRVALLESQQA
jgi:hypothetical protein